MDRARHVLAHKVHDLLGLGIGRFAHHKQRRHVEHVRVFEQFGEGRAETRLGAELDERHKVVDDEALGAVLAHERHKVAQRAEQRLVFVSLAVGQRGRNAHQPDRAVFVGLAKVEADGRGLDHQVTGTDGRDVQARLAVLGPGLGKAERDEIASAGGASIDQVGATPVETAPYAVYDLDAGEELGSKRRGQRGSKGRGFHKSRGMTNAGAGGNEKSLPQTVCRAHSRGVSVKAWGLFIPVVSPF